MRFGHEMVLTPRAEALAPVARRAILSATEVFVADSVEHVSSLLGTFSVAMVDEMITAFAAPVTEAFQSFAPNVDLRVRAFDRSGFSRLEGGRFDAALIPDPRPMPWLPDEARRVELMVIKEIYREGWVVLSSRPWDGSLEAYATHSHVLPAVLGESDIGFVDELLRSQGLTRRVAATVPSLAAAIAVAARTQLLLTVPDSVHNWASVEALERRPVPPELSLPERSIVLVWAPRSTRDRRHELLRSLVYSTVESIADGTCHGP